MSLKNEHPSFQAMLQKWELGRDSYEGEDAIKLKSTTYLPATSGQKADGAGTSLSSEGQQAYEAYKLRAVYPDIYKDSIDASIGIMHREPPRINLPEGMQGMMEDCTLLGESLEMLLRKINAQQLKTGRLGLLGDIRVVDGKPKPIIVLYNELSIRNWDDTSIHDDDANLRVVILDESGYEMQPDFSWKHVTKYRILKLLEEGDNQGKNIGNYGTQLVLEGSELQTEYLIPSVHGEPLNKIPFVFVNSKDVSPTPDIPPLHGLAKACLTIYRGEADYRQSLFMQSQDTLVVIGQTASNDDGHPLRTGAGAMIEVPLNGDAKFIGVSSTGLAEQRSALENDYARAYQKSSQLADATSRAKESGDALRIRVAAQTATLPQIANTGAGALERILKMLAEWLGHNPDEVTVAPNLNFTQAELDAQLLVSLMQAKAMGAPIAQETVHEFLQNKGVTSLTYTEEMDRMENEDSGAFPVFISPAEESMNGDV